MEKELTGVIVEKIKASTDTQSQIAKRVIIWLIGKSENFTKPVAVSIYTADKGKMFIFDQIAEEAQKAMHDMSSGLGDTDICGVLNKLQQVENGKKKFTFWQHFGILFAQRGARAFVSNDIHGINTNCSTIWISPEPYDRNAQIVEFDLEEIEKIEL